MSTEYLELGPVPSDEDCIQVSRSADYMPAMRAECNRYKAMLDRRFPRPDELQGLAWFVVKSSPHDFGSYCEVAVKYDENDERAAQFAYWVEGNTPATWGDEAILVYAEDTTPDDKPEGILAHHARTGQW